MKLLTSPYANQKISKNIELGYFTAPLHLAPYNLSGYQVCPMASKGCAAACLNTAGRGVYQKVQEARIRKTKFFFEDRKEFLKLLCKDIESLCKKAERLKLKPAVRLNATSDIPWEVHGIIEKFPDVQFYDYTKILKRIEGSLPKNYYLIFSQSETNLQEARYVFHVLKKNIAVVFLRELPETYGPGINKNFPVIDGDITDCRFLDPKGVIVGLRAKGKAKKDLTGFTKIHGNT
jgi:hypothetical protein